MTTTLLSILRDHVANRPLVYLSDGATTWYAETLLDELHDADTLDEEDAYALGDYGIDRIGSDGYRQSVPDYRYVPAWQSGDEGLTLTLDTLLDAARQHGELDSDMPTFGGAEPSNTQGVWSWDATRLLVGSCVDDLRIEDREDNA